MSAESSDKCTVRITSLDRGAYGGPNWDFFNATQPLGAWERLLHGAAPGGPLATPGRIEGAGPHRRFCGGWVKPGLLSVSLGVGARCAVVAAGQPAATDGALLFAQVATRSVRLLEMIVLETSSSRWMKLRRMQVPDSLVKAMGLPYSLGAALRKQKILVGQVS